ncbi:uncharacterized protein [Elaeis guineensis]|uniref:Uncharacterized protein LOC105057611 n=1 Tax=Elaeis guineensis var. tenera TaxID=51953 RepID=A0A6I9SFE4_ELAGV|nr:uncharacterized protein LOC105057611 [Elaeis guineensis]
MSCSPLTSSSSPFKLPLSFSSQRKKLLLCRLPRAAAAAATTAPAPAVSVPRVVLHDSLDTAGIDTRFARAARESFCQQVGKLSGIDSETSITISRGADLAKAALHIAAEDDSLVSHSSVPLPVDEFIGRLDDLSTGFCSLYMPPTNAPPEIFLGNLERYFYVHKGFRRVENMCDAKALYLHSVLTCRSGSAIMLSLIYSEMVKMLKIYGFLDFDAEIYFPHDFGSLPRGYLKQKSKMSDQPHIMTSKSLLVEVLRNLKDAFWPFQFGHSSSLFLRAVHAANHIYGPSSEGESALEIASAKAAQHRIERGVWTTVRFGDMRRALAACERLVFLDVDFRELRDYAVLLYHCGFYGECLQCLKSYETAKSCSPRSKFRSNPIEELEEDAVENLKARLNLILGEEGWSKWKIGTSYWGHNLEPW